MRHPIWYAAHRVTQLWGEHPESYVRFSLPGHNGLDVAMPAGTELWAPDDGEIVRVATDVAGYGLYVVLHTLAGGAWLLAHLSDVGATVTGDLVAAGTPIAWSGSTGYSTGPHLHIGYRPLAGDRSGSWRGHVDPLPYLLCGQAG